MGTGKIIATGLAAILLAACSRAETVAPSAIPDSVPVPTVQEPASSELKVLKQYYEGTVISLGYGFQSGNLAYLGQYFLFSDAGRNRGYFVIDIYDDCDPKILTARINEAIKKKQTLFFQAYELSPAVLDLRSCPTIETKI